MRPGAGVPPKRLWSRAVDDTMWPKDDDKEVISGNSLAGFGHRVPTPTPLPLPLREGRQVEII